MAAAPGINGALYDLSTNNKMGALCTLIGYGTNAVYGPPVPGGLGSGMTAAVRFIGGAVTTACGCPWPGKVLTVRTAVGAVAVDAAIPPSGDINRSGKALT